MTPTITVLLIITFLLSTVGLLLLIWSIANNLLRYGQKAVRTLLSPGAKGIGIDPGEATEQQKQDLSDDQYRARYHAHQASRLATLIWESSSVFCLMLGSAYG